MERKMNIHTELRAKYGQGSLKIYWEWEKFECKMADFVNHRCFSLRCLSKGLIPTSIRLKSNIKTPKGKYIIKKAELASLNERIKAINNSIAMFKMVIGTCMIQLEGILDEKTMEDCYRYVKYRREGRHKKTLKDNYLNLIECAIEIQVAAQTSSMATMMKIAAQTPIHVWILPLIQLPSLTHLTRELTTTISIPWGIPLATIIATPVKTTTTTTTGLETTQRPHLQRHNNVC